MTAIVLIAALVALVWGTVFVLRGSLVAGGLAFLIVGACFGHAFLHFELASIPLTLDRLVLLLVVIAYLVQRHLGRTDPKPLRPTDILLMTFLAVLVLSGCWSGWTGSQAGQFVPLWRLIAGYLIPFSVYWIARQAPLGRSQVALVQGTLTGLGAYLAVTGILEITGQWWAVFPKHIADPEIGIHFGRARGPMVHAVSFGLHVGVCLLCAWLYQWRFGRPGRAVLMLLTPLFLAGLLLSYTRSVWIGTALGLAIVLAISLRGIWRPLVLGGMLAACVLLAVTQMDTLISLRREDSAADSRKSVDMRQSFAYVSWKMFLDRPILGFGFGQFPTAKLAYLADRSTDLQLETIREYCHHNTFLSLLTETGLLGLGLFLAVLAGWVRSAWALVRSGEAPDWAKAQGVLLLGVLGIYVCQGMFHELTYTPIDNALVFFLAGVTVGLRTVAEQQGAGQQQGAPALFGWMGRTLSAAQ